ncbi:HNH endonuclease [Candidatus Mycalebacterium sp.]
MRQKGKTWSREENIIVLDLYFRIPFSKSRASHPEVQKVAKIIGRTPASVNLKIGNFGSFDTTLAEKKIKGLVHTSKLDKEIWKEFEGKYHLLSHESQTLKASLLDKNIPEKDERQRIGKDIVGLTKRRVGQRFFRESILASYNNKCCITGIDNEMLLIASHIKPWNKCAKEEKANPQNGLCLNALHDKAFDRGLITVNSDYKIKTSKILMKLDNQAVKDFFGKYEDCKIKIPERLPPDREFLEWHGKNVFVTD